MDQCETILVEIVLERHGVSPSCSKIGSNTYGVCPRSLAPVMPVIRFPIAELERLLGKKVPRDELAQTIPMLGADVDDVKGDTWAIEFFPDRPDLYTVEGIA